MVSNVACMVTHRVGDARLILRTSECFCDSCSRTVITWWVRENFTRPLHLPKNYCFWKNRKQQFWFCGSGAFVNKSHVPLCCLTFFLLPRCESDLDSSSLSMILRYFNYLQVRGPRKKHLFQERCSQKVLTQVGRPRLTGVKPHLWARTNGICVVCSYIVI